MDHSSQELLPRATRLEMTGTVEVFSESFDRIEAQFVDRSTNGARLRLLQDIRLPSAFMLRLPGDESARHACLRWQSYGQAGVQFIEPALFVSLQSELAAPAHDQRMPAPRPQGVLRPRSDGDDACFVPDYEISYESGGGDKSDRCVVELKLYNATGISAVHPFLCVPGLGFNVQPAVGWSAQEFASIRRRIRFTPHEEILKTGSYAVCCRIGMEIDLSNGCLIHYASGIHHSLHTLTDFVVACQAGAGNFPLQRILFVVPASHIAGLILDHVAV